MKQVFLQSIFLDESGKPEVFNYNGDKNLVQLGNASRYLILCAVSTSDQLELQKRVNAFRLSLLEDPEFQSIFTSTYSLSDFHAYKDYPRIKTRFLEFISNLDIIKIDVIVADKLRLPLILQQNPNRMYGSVAGILLGDVIKNDSEIIFSRKDAKLRLQKEIEIEVERERLDTNSTRGVDSNVKISYFHNPHHTHGGLQVADYIAYAVFQNYEKGKPEMLEVIKSKINSIIILPKK